MVGVGKSFPQADALYCGVRARTKMPWDRCLGGDEYNLAAKVQYSWTYMNDINDWTHTIMVGKPAEHKCSEEDRSVTEGLLCKVSLGKMQMDGDEHCRILTGTSGEATYSLINSCLCQDFRCRYNIKKKNSVTAIYPTPLISTCLEDRTGWYSIFIYLILWQNNILQKTFSWF